MLIAKSNAHLWEWSKVKENKKKLCPIDAQLIDNAEEILSIW